MSDTLSPLAAEVFLWPDADQYALRERAAIRSESGEDDATAQAAALAEGRADRARRASPGVRDAASWAEVAAWRRRTDDAQRENLAALAAWERAQGLGRRG